MSLPPNALNIHGEAAIGKTYVLLRAVEDLHSPVAAEAVYVYGRALLALLRAGGASETATFTIVGRASAPWCWQFETFTGPFRAVVR